jgi:hypothetical protein
MGLSRATYARLKQTAKAAKAAAYRMTSPTGITPLPFHRLLVARSRSSRVNSVFGLHGAR